MSSIPKLIENTLDDMGQLAQQYAQLTAIKVKKASKQSLIGMGFIGSGAFFFLIAISELIFSMATLLVDLREIASATALAAGFTIFLGVILAAIGIYVLKKINFDPRASSSLSAKDFDVELRQLSPRGI